MLEHCPSTKQNKSKQHTQQTFKPLCSAEYCLFAWIRWLPTVACFIGASSCCWPRKPFRTSRCLWIATGWRGASSCFSSNLLGNFSVRKFCYAASIRFFLCICVWCSVQLWSKAWESKETLLDFRSSNTLQVNSYSSISIQIY